MSRKCSRRSLEKNPNPKFALLISCTWRKLVLRQRVEEEIEAIYDVVWKDCKIWWFYSYWEIWVMMKKERFSLHNQTMTILLLSEE